MSIRGSKQPFHMPPAPTTHSCPFVFIRGSNHPFHIHPRPHPPHSCPFVSIRVHSCPFVVQSPPPTFIPAPTTSFVTIRVHSWFKTTPPHSPRPHPPHSCPFVSIRGSKQPLHIHPRPLTHLIRVHSCSFVVQITPSTFIPALTHLISVHSWFKTTPPYPPRHPSIRGSGNSLRFSAAPDGNGQIFSGNA